MTLLFGARSAFLLRKHFVSTFPERGELFFEPFRRLRQHYQQDRAESPEFEALEFGRLAVAGNAVQPATWVRRRRRSAGSSSQQKFRAYVLTTTHHAPQSPG